MGIQQLLPFLSKCTEQVNISQFEGWTVAVDAFCWLHKGSYACSEELLLGTPTDKYVNYCLKFIDMLHRYKIKPILVFDGQKLQAKAETEQQRHEKRRSAAIAARRLLLDGNRAEAKRYLGQAISVTSSMAHDVVQACRSAGVDCIVAQYEADSQLAYLSLSGIVNLIISEDSDLLVFGCRRVLFKLDLSGRGELIEQDRLGEVFGGDFSFEKFRYMCILSGCDYLDGVDGIGLSKALRVFRRAKQPDIRKVLSNLSGYLGRVVTLRPGYIEEFVKANNTFLYQLVYDPVERCVQSLNPRPKHLSAADFPYAGKELEPEVAMNLALGNLDPHTLKPFDNAWRPQNSDCSIWSSSYQLPKTPPRKAKGNAAPQTTTASARVVLSSWGGSSSEPSSLPANGRKRKTSPDRTYSVSQPVESTTTKSELLRLYGGNGKCARMSEDEKSAAFVIDESDPEEGGDSVELSTSAPTPSSPVIVSQTSRLIRRNVFSVSSSRLDNGANAFFGLVTQHSETASPYFRPSSSGDSGPSSNNSSALASRLANRRLQCQQSSVSAVETKPKDTSDDVIFVGASVNADKQPSSSDVDKVPSKENKPSNCPKTETDLSKNKTPASNPPQTNMRQSAPIKSGGAVRLLLQKFAYKPAA